LKTTVNDEISEESDLQRTRSRLDYFLLLFPPNALNLILEEKNKKFFKTTGTAPRRYVSRKISLAPH